jgi:hypothetical protein
VTGLNNQGVTVGFWSRHVERRIMRLHGKKMSLRAIARELNEEGVPTTLGGREWYPATISNVIKRLEHS